MLACGIRVITPLTLELHKSQQFVMSEESGEQRRVPPLLLLLLLL